MIGIPTIILAVLTAVSAIAVWPLPVTVILFAVTGLSVFFLRKGLDEDAGSEVSVGGFVAGCVIATLALIFRIALAVIAGSVSAQADAIAEQQAAAVAAMQEAVEQMREAEAGDATDGGDEVDEEDGDDLSLSSILAGM